MLSFDIKLMSLFVAIENVEYFDMFE